MVGWYLSRQARDAVQDALALARERRHAWLGADHLLVAVLRQWDDGRVGGVALLRACGLSDAQVRGLVTDLLHRDGPVSATAVAHPRPSPAARFALAHAFRIAVEARDAYVGTEHLVLALLWQDSVGELRLRGVSYAHAAEELRVLPRVEQAADREALEPLGALAVPTPAAVGLTELARQQAEQHPVPGDGRVSTLHHLLALHAGGTAAGALLDQLGVTYGMVVERVEAEGARLLDRDARRDELPLDGWTRFEVDQDELDTARRRAGQALSELGPHGVRFGMHAEAGELAVDIHPGRSGLEPRAILDRLLAR
jgi:ATP-dependent Clp protease ATP-binding subunit ClpA